jgi:hypothetical protein
MSAQQLQTILQAVKSTFGDQLWTYTLAQMQQAEQSEDPTEQLSAPETEQSDDPQTEEDSLLCPASQKSSGLPSESPYPALFPSFQAAQPEAQKTKKKLSPEHLAALKAGREAAKAKKTAAAAPAAKAEKPKKVLSPEHLAKLKAGREAAKAKKAAEAPSSSAASEAEDGPEAPPLPGVAAQKPKKHWSAEAKASAAAKRAAKKAEKAAEAAIGGPLASLELAEQQDMGAGWSDLLTAM